MEVIKPGTKIDFIKIMPYAVSVSFITGLICLFGIFIWPKPNWGIDFAGGTEIQVQFKQPIEMGKLRSAMESMNLGDVKVQEWLGAKTPSTQFLIRLEKLANESEVQDGGTAAAPAQAGATGRSSALVEAEIAKVFGAGTFEILKAEYVGPKAGAELRNQGALAVIIANLLILVYVTLRYEFRYAFGAVIALFHDAIFAAGIIVFTQKAFDLTIIAALLSIVGYSINDTIVVFDRIRETLSRQRRLTLYETVNLATNETLSRTLLTSFVTFLAVFFLWLLGGSVINGFSFCMMIGIIVGTYSSVFVASAYVVFTERMRDRRRTTAVEATAK